MVRTILLLILTWNGFIQTGCLDNGLALTPPMGWLTWERFRCNTDCKSDPENCISEHLILTMAKRMAEDGYLAAGYEYISVDDCWPEYKRDTGGKLQPDHERFPTGIKNLTDKLHSLGLKFGIYEDFGTKTCAGYPGSEFYLQTDAQTFADWGVDLLKFDGCNSNFKDDPYGYPAMGMYLNKTGRPIVYSCEWPLQNRIHHTKPDYKPVRETCNFWRNYDDINDSWDSIKNAIQFYGADYGNFSGMAGPGAWNDPDMLVIGNYGLSHTQERTQMAMWAIFAAPLIMSVDLRTIPQPAKDILLNKRVIAVNQDKLGIAGRRVVKDKNLEVWARPIVPKGSKAIVFLNLNEGGGPTKMVTSLLQLGLDNKKGYRFTETFDGTDLDVYYPLDVFVCFVDPTGVYMVTAIAL